MRIKKSSYFSNKLRNLFWVLFQKMENNGNPIFAKNGEEQFINSLFSLYKSQQITIFDVGANMGEYAEVLLDKSKKTNVACTIHMFEPTSNCFNVLKGKFSNHQNIILNKAGISDTEGKMEIFFDKQGSSLASLYQRDLQHINVTLNQSEIIDLIRLESYIAEKKIEHIHFLKIDIEGHDLFGIKSVGSYLKNDFIDFIQFEYGGTNLDSRTALIDFYNLLEKAGFTICKVKRNSIEPRKYAAFMENYNYANYIAVSDVFLKKTIV